MEPPFMWVKSIAGISTHLQVQTELIGRWLRDSLLPHVEITAEAKLHRFVPAPYLALLGSTVKIQPPAARCRYLIDFSRKYSDEITGLRTAFDTGITTLVDRPPVDSNELAEFFGYPSAAAGRIGAWCIFTMQNNRWTIDPRRVRTQIVWRSVKA